MLHNLYKGKKLITKKDQEKINTLKDFQDENTEEEMQIKDGVNGKLPDLEYTYEAIVDSVGGICKIPSSYEENYQENKEKWRENLKEEVKKIEPKLTDDAGEDEIDHLFKQFLYLVAYDYPVIEPIQRYSYLVFKNDKEDPFTHKPINENININLEIALDCSGSMAKSIGNQTMMDIAKDSIQKVISQMPENSKVGLRVFGHKGNNKNSGKAESCQSCELIQPIASVSEEEITEVLKPIGPTGWTCIGKSIEEGVKDLSAFNGEKDLNILYIVTDGIETCNGNPVEMAKKLKDEQTNIVLGIIGFNVDANQNLALKQIADAGGGYYPSAKDAAELTSQLETIHELAYSDYKWEELDESLLNMVKRYHEGGLIHNKLQVQREPISEKNSITTLIALASSKDIFLFPSGDKVEKRLHELVDERYTKITDIFKAEYAKREKESQEYRNSIAGRIGETVALIPTTSRVNPDYNYFSGYSNKGGDSKEQVKDTEKLENTVNPNNEK